MIYIKYICNDKFVCRWALINGPLCKFCHDACCHVSYDLDFGIRNRVLISLVAQLCLAAQRFICNGVDLGSGADFKLGPGGDSEPQCYPSPAAHVSDDLLLAIYG